MSLQVFLFRVRSKKVNVSVTINVCTHLGLEDSEEELKRVKALACKKGNREKAGHIVGAVIIQIGLMLCFPASPRAVFFLSNAKKVSVQLPFEVRTAIFLFSKNYTCPHFPQSEHPLQISRLPHSLQLSR